MRRRGPLAAGAIGAAAGLVATAFGLLVVDRAMPFLMGVPVPAPWTVTPGLVLAVVASPGIAAYIAGEAAASAATGVRPVAFAMAIAVGLLACAWAIALGVASHH